VEFAERFGATVDVAAPTTDIGYFLVQRHESVDHTRFRRVVAEAIGDQTYIQLDAPSGFVVVATGYETAQALRAHRMVAHVGGVTIDPERMPTPEVTVRDETERELSE
jgi:hypothetical protein